MANLLVRLLNQIIADLGIARRVTVSGTWYKLLANNRVVRWLATYQQDYLSEFQKIAEIDTLGPIGEAPGA